MHGIVNQSIFLADIMIILIHTHYTDMFIIIIVVQFIHCNIIDDFGSAGCTIVMGTGHSAVASTKTVSNDSANVETDANVSQPTNDTDVENLTVTENLAYQYVYVDLQTSPAVQTELLPPGKTSTVMHSQQ